MKQGGGNSGGFTIIETLIVLAVTGVLAASIILLVSGRQDKVEFQTAANSLQQQMQELINETKSGYYPNNDQIQCTTLHDGSAPQITAGNVGQGANSGCVFIGKAVRFGRGTSGSLSADTYTVYPLAGTQVSTTGQPITQASQTQATAISTGDQPSNIHTPPLESIDTLQNGLTFQWADYVSGSGTTHFTGPNIFAITPNFSANVGSLFSGGLTYGLYVLKVPAGFDWTDTVTSSEKAVDTIDSYGLADDAYNAVALCFASGTTSQSTLITIGDSSNGGLGVTSQIKNGTNC